MFIQRVKTLTANGGGKKEGKNIPYCTVIFHTVLQVACNAILTI